MNIRRRAKIVATLGPVSSDATTIGRLLAAGADVFRLNLSHGTHASHRATIAAVRKAARAAGREIPVLLDLMGPRFRLGEIPNGPRVLRRGERITLGDDSGGVDLPVDDPEFLGHLRVGERVLIDNGLVELEIVSKRAHTVGARVVFGGAVSTRKGINLPDSRIPFTISEKDCADIRFAVAEGADYLAASYVARARDVTAVREMSHSFGSTIPVVAKLERRAAVAHVEEIVAASDAVMVARGDLGVEIPLHEVPVLQKRIVASGRRHGKPVIVATQMLESMMERPRPTRAETSDVANAVLDGADALMLSGETAAGRFPIESVKTMARIVVETEEYGRDLLAEGATAPAPTAANGRHTVPAPRLLDAEGLAPAVEVADVIAAAAVHAASKLRDSRIVAFSQGGFTARRLARYRPVVPALVFTTDAAVARRMQLLWGTHPIHLAKEVQHRDDLVEVVERELLVRRLTKPGECLILLMGYPIEERKLTNLLRIHRVAER